MADDEFSNNIRRQIERLRRSEDALRNALKLPIRETLLGDSMTPQQMIDALVAQVTATIGVEASAVTFINGVPGLISAAVTAALAGGATAAQLAPLSTLAANLQTSAAAITAAIAANAPTPAPAPTPTP